MTAFTPTPAPAGQATPEALSAVQATAAALLGTAAVTLRADGQPALPLTAVGAFYRTMASVAMGQHRLLDVAAEAARNAHERHLAATAHHDGLAAMAFPLPSPSALSAPHASPATPSSKPSKEVPAARNGAANGENGEQTLVVFTTPGVRADLRPLLAAELGLPAEALSAAEPFDAEKVSETLRLLEGMLRLVGGAVPTGPGGTARRDLILYDAARLLMTAPDEETVLRITAETLAGILHMDRGIPYVPDPEGWIAREGASYWGEPARDPPPLEIPEDVVQALRQGSIIRIAQKHRPRSRRLLVPMLAHTPDGDALEAVIDLETAHALHPILSTEEDLARLVAGQAVLALRATRVATVQSTLARKLQQTLQSRIASEALPDLRVEKFYAPAAQNEQVGGDFFDVFPLPGGRVVALVGDVAGKGVDAAIHTNLARYTLRAYALMTPDPAEILRLANEALARFPEFRDFITVALFVLDPEAGQLAYASAGHCPAFLYRRGADAIGTLESTGTLLGMMPGLTWESAAHKWLPGDALLLYTDGISEAHAHGSIDLFETTRIRDLFAANRRAAPRAVVEAIFKAAFDFSGGILHDDCAMLLVTRPTG